MSRKDRSVDTFGQRHSQLRAKGKRFRQPRGFRLKADEQRDLRKHFERSESEPSPPKEWEDIFPNVGAIGKEYQRPWNKWSKSADYYKNLLAQHGYELNWNKFIYIGTDNKFDHSVWKVRKIMEGLGGFDAYIMHRREKYYACKVVGFNAYFIEFKDFHASIRAMYKEAQILLRLHHPNVVKVYDYINLPDSETNFPYTYLAIIMELLDGSLEKLVPIAYPNGMPLNICKILVRQIAQALEYLHFQIIEPEYPSYPEFYKDQPLSYRRKHIAHMAIQPRNLLYKANGDSYVFKLGDFENCNIYDESDIAWFGQTLDSPSTGKTFWAFDIKCLALCWRFALAGGPEKYRDHNFPNDFNVQARSLFFHMAYGGDYGGVQPSATDILRSKWINEQ